MRTLFLKEASNEYIFLLCVPANGIKDLSLGMMEALASLRPCAQEMAGCSQQLGRTSASSNWFPWLAGERVGRCNTN
jgi:hypothetical protein